MCDLFTLEIAVGKLLKWILEAASVNERVVTSILRKLVVLETEYFVEILVKCDSPARDSLNGRGEALALASYQPKKSCCESSRGEDTGGHGTPSKKNTFEASELLVFFVILTHGHAFFFHAAMMPWP